MNLNLSGKSVIVTGGGAGIGKAVSFLLAEEGAGYQNNWLREKTTSPTETNAIFHIWDYSRARDEASDGRR